MAPALWSSSPAWCSTELQLPSRSSETAPASSQHPLQGTRWLTSSGFGSRLGPVTSTSPPSLPSGLSQVCAGHGGCHGWSPKPRSAERLSRGIRRPAGKGSVSERPRTFQRYRQRFCRFPAARAWLTGCRPAARCRCVLTAHVSCCSLDKGPSSQSRIQRAIRLKPLLPILRCIIFPKDKMHLYCPFQTCIVCLHLSAFAQAWDR